MLDLLPFCKVMAGMALAALIWCGTEAVGLNSCPFWRRGTGVFGRGKNWDVDSDSSCIWEQSVPEENTLKVSSLKWSPTFYVKRGLFGFHCEKQKWKLWKEICLIFYQTGYNYIVILIKIFRMKWVWLFGGHNFSDKLYDGLCVWFSQQGYIEGSPKAFC